MAAVSWIGWIKGNCRRVLPLLDRAANRGILLVVLTAGRGLSAALPSVLAWQTLAKLKAEAEK
jgi:hypothetical protein